MTGRFWHPMIDCVLYARNFPIMQGSMRSHEFALSVSVKLLPYQRKYREHPNPRRSHLPLLRSREMLILAGLGSESFR